MANTTAIPGPVADEAVRRIREALKAMGEAELAAGWGILNRRGSLYVHDLDGSPLGRLKYTGGMEWWDLHLYLRHTDEFDPKPSPCGVSTLEVCVEVLVEMPE